MENWVIWLALGLFVVFLVVLYNRLVALRQRRRNAFSDIDVQLKVRADLIPNLVETVKGYAAHEKTVFDDVTQARATAMRGGTVAERSQAESALGAAMMNLLAVAENYPQLKADGSFQKLQAELADLENKIAASRRFFNNATNEYNTAIEQFPSVLIAKSFGFQPETFFELSAEEQRTVQTPPSVTF